MQDRINKVLTEITEHYLLRFCIVECKEAELHIVRDLWTNNSLKHLIKIASDNNVSFHVVNKEVIIINF